MTCVFILSDSVFVCVIVVHISLWSCVQMKRKELLQRDDDDGDSMLSSATSDTSSTKRKR